MIAQARREPLRRFIGNLLIPLTLIAVMAVCFVETLDYPDVEDVGPAAAPYLWMVFTAGFCLFLAARALLRKGTADPVPGHVRAVWLTAAWMVAYLVAIQVTGYFISTAVFLVGAMLGLRYRNPWVIAAVTVGWLVFCYVVFYRLLFIPLPVGPLLEPLIG